jgi:translation initiation factor eIF-2B subunit epsilon
MSDLRVEEPLQAVVLADSFATRLRPVTLQPPPKALLPLCGVPLIEYTLEFLAASGVKQVILVCSTHGHLIEQYVNSTQQYRAPGFPQVVTLTLPHCRSSVDALRFVGEKNMIRSDPFVLVHSDVVANVQLKPVLDAHKKRASVDNRNVMTMVLKRVPYNHRTRSVDDERLVALAVDEDTSKVFASKGGDAQLLLFKDTRRQSKIKIPSNLFTGGGPYMPNPKVSLHFDLMDCHLDLCSPHILGLLSDEFDWSDLRKHMVEEILSSEILGYKIHASVIGEEYAARVTDFKTYDAVSRDMIARWAYPVTIENMKIFSGDVDAEHSYQYELLSRNVYRERDVMIARSANVGPNTVIGRKTIIGDNTRIYDCVIGSNCKIGNNVTLSNSYIWDNVTIEDGVFIDRSLLCNGSYISRNAKVHKGSIISYGVKIGSDFEVAEYSRLTKVEEAAENTKESIHDFDAYDFVDSSASKEMLNSPKKKVSSWKASEVGVGGEGRLYDDTASALQLLGIDVDQFEEDEVSHIDKSLVLTLGSLAPACSLVDFEHDIYRVEDEDDDDYEEKEGILTAEDSFELLLKEVYETCQRYWNETKGISMPKVDKKHVELEVSDLKPSMHATLRDFAAAVFISIFRFVVSAKNSDSSKDEKKLLSDIQKWWHFIFKKYTDSDDNGVNDSEIEVVRGLKRACVDVETDGRKIGGVYFNYWVQALQWLYLDDVVSGATILSWYDEELDEQDSNIHALLEPFIKIVRDNEADDDEEDEEE